MKLKQILFIIFLSIPIVGHQVDTLVVYSESMDKNISNIIITPLEYSSNINNYPVLYLLHGAGGDFTDWITKVPKIKEYADDYNMIIVCPDGGHNSWYFDSPIDSSLKYETYISEELIKNIDANFRTIKNRDARAITGLSMGGHGSFYLAFKNQDVWGAVGSMSGGLDLRSFANNWDIKKRLGIYAKNKENWESHSVINLVYLLNGKNFKIIFDCGIDDFFYSVNKKMHEKLLERNIPHDFIERPGKHSWDYWANSIKYQLLFFNNIFNQL